MGWEGFAKRLITYRVVVNQTTAKCLRRKGCARYRRAKWDPVTPSLVLAERGQTGWRSSDADYSSSSGVGSQLVMKSASASRSHTCSLDIVCH